LVNLRDISLALKVDDDNCLLIVSDVKPSNGCRKTTEVAYVVVVSIREDGQNSRTDMADTLTNLPHPGQDRTLSAVRHCRLPFWRGQSWIAVPSAPHRAGLR
jgi:hypothetical protein